MGLALALGAAATVLFSAAPIFAQSCPEGTVLSRVEESGEERIIHCAKPQKGPDAALRLLRKSELGRTIADFIEARRIPIRVTDRDLGPGTVAAFDWVKKELLLPRNTIDSDAVSLAVALAHEGYHAMQLLRDGMVPCIEAEQDAYFIGFVAYVEMVRAGAAPIPKNGGVASDLRQIAAAVHRGNLWSTDRSIAETYESLRSRLFHIGDWLKPLGRLVVAFTVRTWDAVYDLTEDFETLDRKQRHVAYWWDKGPVKRTRAAHQRTVEWKEKWIGENRYDEFAGL